MKRKPILEALTAQEKTSLSGYSPDFIQSVNNVAGSLRKGGRQVALPQIIQQMGQFYKGNPEIEKYLRQSANLVAPMAQAQTGRPSQPGITPPPAQFAQQAANQYNQSLQTPRPSIAPGQTTQNKMNVAPPPEWLRQQGAAMGGIMPSTAALNAPQAQMAQQGLQRIAGQTPGDLDQQTAARVKTQQARQQAGTDLTPQDQQQRQSLAVAKTVPPGWARKKAAGMKKENRGNLQELNMAMLGSTVKNVMNAISRMKPEELIAIANFINSLMGSATKPGASSTSMTSTSISSESNLMKNKYQKVLKENLVEQYKTKIVVERFLNEGPMSSVWQGIKDAGSQVAGGLGLGSMAGQQQNIGVDENTKRLGQELTKLIGKVNQQRQKFNAAILKNSESVSQYHDLVLHLWQAYNQNLQALGPFGQQLQRQVQDAVGNFHYDLTSEKEQIDTFLSSLRDVKSTEMGNSEVMGKAARASTKEKRQAEADANQRMSSSRAVMAPGQHRALDAMQANITPAKEELKKKFLTARSPAEKQQAYKDLEKLLIKTSKQGSKKDSEDED